MTAEKCLSRSIPVYILANETESHWSMREKSPTTWILTLPSVIRPLILRICSLLALPWVTMLLLFLLVMFSQKLVLLQEKSEFMHPLDTSGSFVQLPPISHNPYSSLGNGYGTCPCFLVLTPVTSHMRSSFWISFLAWSYHTFFAKYPFNTSHKYQYLHRLIHLDLLLNAIPTHQHAYSVAHVHLKNFKNKLTQLCMVKVQECCRAS